jgi:hypothetical protein
MCLSSVTTRLEPTTMVQSGWKKFRGYEAYKSCTPSLRFEAYAFQGSETVPLDKWIAAEVKEVKISTFKKYDAGFHIYEDEKENLPGKRRVYFRKAHTRGIQDGLTVVIAAEMYVPSDPDDWPPKD